jgi:hypothetical protein
MLTQILKALLYVYDYRLFYTWMLLSVGDWRLRVQALSKIWDKRIFE